MKIVLKSGVLLVSVLLLACAGKDEKKKEGFSIDRQKTTEKVAETPPPTSNVKASERIDLTSKGVGSRHFLGFTGNH